jgi:DNA ligase-associated metallophosphoesterase
VSKALEVFLGGQHLWLLPEKAVYWPAQKALLLSDAHFGKISHFRKAGIALPDKAAIRNFQKFKKLLDAYTPEQVYFLGDLFHSELNAEWFGLKQVLRSYPSCTFHLIEGNHDILDISSYQNTNFVLHGAQLQIETLLCTHEPLEEVPEGCFNLCGHIHPGVRLYGEARQSMRFPCFYAKANQLILPAYGEFTGLHLLKPQKTEQVWVCVGEKLVQVT